MPVNPYDNPSSIPPGHAGLEVYVEHSPDRDPPPYYAGRHQLLSDIENTCKYVWKQCHNRLSTPKGTTRVLYGAPGAGKSSTLAWLRHSWSKGHSIAQGGKYDGPAPVVIFDAACELLTSPENFYAELMQAALPGSGEQMFAKTVESVRKRIGSSLQIVQGEYESEHRVEFAVDKARLRTVARALPPYEWTHPVVVAIDEAQAMNVDDHSPSGRVLRELHANDADLPVVMLLAGLSDTPARVSMVGLSRLSQNYTYSLKGLNVDELEELKQGFCSYFEISLGKRERKFDALLSKTDGWPAHVQNCLKAFAKVYLSVKCETEDVDFDKVELLSRASRMEYYHARMSPAMRQTNRLLSRLIAQSTDDQNAEDYLLTIDQLDRECKSGDQGLRGLPDGMTSLDYYYTLIHHGALQEFTDGTVNCPIPSFRQYLIEAGRRHPSNGSHREIPYLYGFSPEALTRIEAAHSVRQA